MDTDNQKTILLVEDDAIIALSQTQIIEGFGYSIIHVNSGSRAVETAIGNPSVDLILMDIDLGDGINGLEAAQQILNVKNLPIVFLSSHIEREYKNLVDSITGYGYVEKNSSEHVLKIAIEMALKLFTAHEETRKREQALLESQNSLQKKHLQMKFLSDLSLSVASHKHDKYLPEMLAQQLKTATNASFVSIQYYDEQKMVLKTQKILTDKDVLNKLIDNFGRGLLELESPVSDEMYATIVESVVGKRYSLTDMSFGMIPKHVDMLYRKISGVNRYYGLAFIINEKLYGTASFGIHKDQPEPSDEFLSSFAHIAAIALKKKITENELQRSEQNFRNLVTSLNDAVFTVDENGILRYITDSIEAIMGYKPEELVGHPFAEFIYPEDLPGLLEQFQSTMSGNLTPYDFRIIKKNGEIFWVRTSSKPTVLDEIKNIHGLTGLLIDITKEKYSQEKIYNLLNEKVLILKEVHHRIKNNMTMVASLLNIQSRNFKDPEVVEAFQSTAKRVQSMMVLYDRLYRENNFLELSAKVYFTSLIAEIMPTLTTIGDLEIIQEINDEILPVKILTNLGILINEVLTNIVKHSSQNRKKVIINLVYRKNGNQNLLEISDNGSGLPEDFTFEKAETFGLQLIQILVQQINGKLSYHKDDKNIIHIEFILDK